MLRWALACVTLLIGCEVPVESAPPSEFAAASSAAEQARTPAPSASASDRPAPKPARLPAPASFIAYDAEVEAKCPYDEGNGSTSGMVAGKLAASDCQARIMEIDARKLSPAQRGALLDGDPKGPHASRSGPTPSRWSGAIDAACRVESAQHWLRGGTFVSGSIERILQVGCFADADRVLGFIMRAWTTARPEDVVALVRVVASNRPAPQPRLALWRRYATLARRTAPHMATPDCSNLICRWSDAEWIGFELDMERAETGSRDVSTALCAEWQQLAAAFGDTSSCEAEMSTLWLPSWNGMEDEPGDEGDPTADALADPPDSERCPPADAAYDAATLSLRRAWAKEGSWLNGAARYLADVEKEILAGPRKDLARWLRRTATWRDRFAVAENQADLMAYSSDTSRWLSAPRANIGPTGRLLEGYLLRMIVAQDEEALREHVRARQRWGTAVETNLEKARDAFEKPCKPNNQRDCKGGTPAGFRRVTERLSWLLTEGRALGGALCDAAPELQSALGSECPALTSNYLFSFGEHTGDPSLLDGW